MPAQWTGRLVGAIHNAGLTIKQVAEEASLNPKYVSTLLNGEADAKKAEEKLWNALGRLVTNEKSVEDK